MNGHPWIQAGFVALIFSALRYFLIAGGAFLAFWVVGKKAWARYRIQAESPEAWPQIREFLWSLSTIFVFGVVGIAVYALEKVGWGRLYFNFDRFPPVYLPLSVLAMILLHDAYFYAIHRVLHLPWVYQRIHYVHHQSTNPSPLAAYSFHPLEAAAQGLIVPLLVVLLPLHPLALFIFLIYTTVLNVWGHLGFEFLPSGFARHPVWGLSNTSVHHNMHHSKVTCNFSLYFNFWDKLMGTNHPQYHERFEGVKGSSSEAATRI